ncbi:dihydrofolate reductase family protein [Dyella sp. A6]|uniref:dihydrofolate reductase family protein n=1 Tax=Dyella aluminiiresistens TaxID=3069105 RepID=UPI002E7A1AF1|nr:dihydrofolate reductase family protein [Dyella sp. A6]
MRKLIVPAFISLDGVMQAPGGPQEDTSNGFVRGGWIWPYADSSIKPMDGLFEQPIDLLLGRRTYDIFASYWPQVPADAPHRGIADRFNQAAKHVATHHADTLDWQNSYSLGLDILATVRALKLADGPDLVTQGSSELVHQLLASDLVDELRLLVYPLLLGAGKRLFDDRAQAAAFRLASSKTTPGGVQVNRYLHEGPVRTGSFG